ncbi:MAG: helix-turn-helix transcriptional regulator [Deltaproteobacteria bacterium]|jgi:ribosome-binding protein aMBF1 (putative translation factor)|nr:helix-turn-helix transcriptional regulator [Deltaproteobacteria bacterium]
MKKTNHPLKNYLIGKNSIKELAKKINKSERIIYYYLNFEKFPSRSTAKKISELTGIPVIKLLYLEDGDA